MNRLVAQSDRGNPQAQFELAQWYSRNRLHDSYHMRETFSLYEAAAEQGHLPAQTALAQCYLKGCGCEPSKEKARELYLLAAEAGDSTAQSYLGYDFDWHPEDKDNAEYWLQKSADQDNGWGCYHLAQYRLDENGKYTPEAVELLRRGAVTKIDPCQYAQFQLGRCLAAGEGVAQDKIEAFAWLGLVFRGEWPVADAAEELSKLIPTMSPNEVAEAEILTKQFESKYSIQ